MPATARLPSVCRGAVAADRERHDDRGDRGFSEEADLHALTVLLAEAAREHRKRVDDPAIDATLRKRIGKGLVDFR